MVLSMGLQTIGTWFGNSNGASFSAAALAEAIARYRSPAYIVREGDNGRVGVAHEGIFQTGSAQPGDNGSGTDDAHPCLGILPALYPEWLGDRSFLEAHGLRFPYVTGAMARGIASASIVVEMARAGMLGFFGSGGLSIERVESALASIEEALSEGQPWGCNLIHSPQEPELENRMVDLLLRWKVRRVSAAAFMSLTPAVVRYAFTGVRREADGQIVRENHIFAKISRPEVAEHFMSPPSAEMVEALVESGDLTREEADLAMELPIAEDYTVESDSGGHTDNRPLGSLFPTIAQMRDAMIEKYNYARPLRLGAAGGLGTPESVASAFALGASFVLTGSVNQSCRESGVSEDTRAMLAKAELADMTMCPSADMFELGVKVQVLKRGTMFAARADRLYSLYTRYDSLDAIPQEEVQRLESQIFRRSLADVWNDTRAFFESRNPLEAERAERDPKHQMALVFRSYLGLSSRWPIDGTAERRLDYQIWCGPAMGAFNAWVKDSFLEAPDNRTVVQVARNLLEGAAFVTRGLQLRSYGVPVPAAALQFRPRELQ